MENFPKIGDIGHEKQESEKRYDPVYLLRERDGLDPEIIKYNEKGEPIIDDQDLHYIFKDILRRNVKDGSVLNLGSGIAHCHQMLALVDKITHITALDMEPKNNQLIRELLEASQGIGTRVLIERSDQEVFKTTAEAMAHDDSYGIMKSGQELISLLWKKSQYNERLDIIEADMIEQMDKLGSGELVDGRGYDNILMLFASFTRSKEETIEFLKNIKQRLNNKGRLLILDGETYEGPKLKIDNLVLMEGEEVIKKYSQIWDWTPNEMQKALEEAGFSKISLDIKEPSSDSKEEQRTFGKYIFFIAEK